MFVIGILKILLIIVLAIIGLPILIVLVVNIKSRIKEINDKHKIEILKAKYPLYKPVKVSMDLVYLDNNYNYLTEGLIEILRNKITEGYITRESANTIKFNQTESGNENKNITIVFMPSDLKFINAMRFFNIKNN